MGALVPDGRDRFPVSQRTLDLKTESAYFRVRLCVPRPRAPRVPASVQSSTLGSPARSPLPHRSQRARRVLGTAERGRVRHGDHARARQDPRRRRGRDTHRPPLVRARDWWDETGARTRRDHRMRMRRRRRAMPRRRRAKGADRAGDADDDARRDGMSRERARRGAIVGRPRRRVRRERPGAAIDYRAPSL